METRRTKYPIGVQDFESLRKDGYTYVDKTSHILRMVDEGRCYFLSRPRRFGKSLLLSTIAAYFEGKRELFKGLAIDRDDVDWTPRPVIRFDLNAKKYTDEAALDTIIGQTLTSYEAMYGKYVSTDDIDMRFADLLRHAHEQTGRRAVVLIDEYDKPMLEALGNPELLEAYRSTLHAFYSVLKSSDAHLKFALLTGVTKFSKVTIFSGLNNLQDISLSYRYAEICGLTEQEIRENFDEGVRELAARRRMTLDEAYAELRRRYDGYRFTADEVEYGMYNPFSVINALNAGEFRDYWFQTGTPSFLIHALKNSHYALDRLVKDSVTEDLLGSIDAMERTPLPLLYQSGYLTIKSYNEEFRSYTLDFPNDEVERGFAGYLVNYYTRQQGGTEFFVQNFVSEIRSGQPDAFMERLDAFFADGDYQIAGRAELYFQNCMYIVFKMLGFYVQAERHTSRGRVDVVMQTPDYVYLFEIKLDGTVEAAMQQIEDKQYAAPFAADGRTVFKIGANFSSVTRHFTDWQISE